MKADHFSVDIQEFLFLLEKYGVRYVIVGGEAVIYYGYARLTGDVDFFCGNYQDNGDKLYQALFEFWDGDIPGIQSKEELLEPGMMIQFGVPPNRLDILNHIDTLDFHEVWLNRKEESIQIKGKDIRIYFIGIDDLIKSKEAAGRYKDLEDLKYLMEAKGR